MAGLRDMLAGGLDWVGTKLGAPEYGWSERIAGGPTQNTGITAQSQKAGYTPYTPANYTPNVPYQWNTNVSGGSGGSVAGASTNNNNNSSGGGYTPQQALNLGLDANALRQQGKLIETQSGPDPYVEQQKGLINNQFGSYFSNLDRLLGVLPEEQKSYESQIGNMATEQQGQITSDTGAAKQTLEQGKGQAETRKGDSLKDLYSNMRNALYASSQYLGQRGASDSSAQNMYSAALSKQSSKNQSGIVKQFNDAMSTIDLKIADVDRMAADQNNQLNTWKNNQLLQVTDYIRQQKNTLETQRSQGIIDRDTALRELNTTVYNTAQQKLAQIDAQATSFQQGLQQWAMNRASQLNNFKLQLQNTSNFSVPEMVQSEMNYMPQASVGQGSDLYGSYSPYSLQGFTKKKTENGVYGY